MRTLTMMSIVLICASPSVSQTQPSKPMPSSPMSSFDQELVNKQNQFQQALAEKNIAYVNQSVADDFRGIGTNGDFYDKGELVGSAHEGMPKDVRVYDMQVVKLNDDSAIVTYDLIVPGARPRYRHMSDTWAKQSGQWKLKFQQVTRNLWSATDYD